MKVIIIDYDATFLLAPDFIIYKTTVKQMGNIKEKITVQKVPKTFDMDSFTAVSLFNSVLVRRFLCKAISGKEFDYPKL